MAAIAGDVEIIAAGRRISVKSDSSVEIQPQTVQRETILAQSGAVGSKRTAVAPSIKFTAIITPDILPDIVDLYTSDDVSVICTLTSGQTFAMDGCHFVGAPPIDMNTAEHAMELHGTSASLG